LEAASIGGTVVFLRDPDVRGAVEDAFDAHPSLGAGQRCTGARMDTTPECDVARGVWPTDVGGFWPGDLAGIAVGGAVEHHHGRAGGNVDPAHVGSSDLGVHLVGGDLKQWFVGFDGVAD